MDGLQSLQKCLDEKNKSFMSKLKKKHLTPIRVSHDFKHNFVPFRGKFDYLV